MNTLSTMDGLCRLLVCVAFVGSGNIAFAGNFYGPTCGPDRPYPAQIAGVYVQTNVSGHSLLRLEIRQDGTASLGYNTLPLMATSGGIIRMAGTTYAANWPRDEFVFDGIGLKGDEESRRYKREWNREREQLEILDITDPSNPIRLTPEEPPFPWTATCIVSTLIVGVFVGRYSAKHSSIAQNSIRPIL